MAIDTNDDKVTITLDEATVAVLTMAYRIGVMDERNGDVPDDPAGLPARVLHMIRQFHTGEPSE